MCEHYTLELTTIVCICKVAIVKNSFQFDNFSFGWSLFYPLLFHLIASFPMFHFHHHSVSS